jgi:uncharacterized membrane protein
MAILALGLLLFTGVHLVPSLAPGLKARWQERLGTQGYRGSFSLLLLAAVGLIVAGWRSTPPALLYLPSPQFHAAGIGLLNFAFLLMVVSGSRSRLKLIIRHPQLTGVLLWGIAHLLLNGDSRSLLLFGGLSAWAVVEMVAINRRDGAWIRQEAPPWSRDIVNLLVTAVVIALVIYIHPWIAGVPVHYW